jgi:hypothetical protein
LIQQLSFAVPLLLLPTNLNRNLAKNILLEQAVLRT